MGRFDTRDAEGSSSPDQAPAGHPGERPGPSYVQRPGVVSAELDGEISLFDGSDTALVMNSTASAIWQELSLPCTVTELTSRLAGRFTAPDGPLDPEAIAVQIEDLLRDLVERGLVTTAP
jgi:hypothetical protein